MPGACAPLVRSAAVTGRASWSRNGGFQSHGATPRNHPFQLDFNGFFHYKMGFSLDFHGIIIHFNGILIGF